MGGAWIARNLWSPEPAPSLPPLQATLQLTDPHLTHGQNGSILWELQGQQASYDQSTDILRVTAPHIQYFSPHGPVTASALQGLVWQKRGEAELTGNLTAQVQDHTIRAQSMRYSEADSRLVLTGAVQMRGPRLDLDAPEVQVFLSEERITAIGGVQAVFHPARK
ncbi:hypothetical protein TDMWS_15450 [Thermodesulfomicrobium sp. WS]|nr:hypothetical protein TDMWS_15450 [Thermodesulfomicrobium sp. WS]